MNSAPKDWDKQQIRRRASFLQSALWGDFQQISGSAPHYLRGDTWSCLLLEKKTPLGRYLFAPYGPTLDTPNDLDTSIQAIAEYGRRAGADWLCLEPMLSGGASGSLKKNLANRGARPAGHNREPSLTRVLDLSRSEDEILASFSQSTRSFIRKNQREKLLDFKTSVNPDDISIFISMLSKVSERNRVSFFPDSYFKNQAGILMPAGAMFLELAAQNGKLVAGAVFHQFGDTSYYTYAASLPEARQTSASALLLWKAIISAKARGAKRMDLFGIAPEDASASHPWYGFSAFKSKFGGQIEEYAGTWEIPFSGKYRLYRSAQAVRQLIRRH